MRARAPMVVSPAMTTWLISSQPAPSSTFGPTTQNGPMRQPGPIFAPSSIIAVGVNLHSTHDITSMALISAWGDDLPIDTRLTVIPPHVPAIGGLAHVICHNVAWLDGLAELRLVDGHEIDLLGRIAVGDLAGHADRAGRLGHALDQKHAGKDRTAGEMASELRFVRSHVLDGDTRIVTIDINDSCRQQKWIAMRQIRH